MSKKKVDDLRGVIFCCHGGSCTKSGARTVEKALRLHARESGHKDAVKFVRTACTGLCKSAPIVIVCANSQGQEAASSTCGAHWKREVRPEEAPAIFDAHFGGAVEVEASSEKKRKKAKK